VSEIAFGGWQLGGQWGDVDDEASIKTLLHAFTRGVNFVDTAEFYGEGHSEEVIGEALRHGTATRSTSRRRFAPSSGRRPPRTTRRWRGATPSGTADRGELDLDQPVAEYWPAFDRPATASITCRTVLAHRAGLPAVDRPLTHIQIAEGELERALERQEPYWEPGTAHGYHTITFGTLLDGIFTRAVGVSVGEYARRHIVDPLGLRLSFGVPAVDGDIQPVLFGGAMAVEQPDMATTSTYRTARGIADELPSLRGNPYSLRRCGVARRW
jgi:hypothetical protein